MSLKDEINHILALKKPSQEDFKGLVRMAKIAGARGFARQVKEMREAQKSYFATRMKSTLDKSKKLEQKVDDAIETIIEGMK